MCVYPLYSCLFSYTYTFIFSDDFDLEPIIDWLRFNVGDDEACQKLLNSLKTKIDKANDLINQLRAMGHDIDDDYVVDLNFFDNEWNVDNITAWVSFE